MNERYEKVLKELEERVGYNLDKLKKIRDNIVDEYKRKYAIDVSSLYFEIKNMKKFYTLTERCFKRDYDIRMLCREEYNDEIEEAKILFSIIKGVLPFEILYGIDIDLIDNIFLDEEEQVVYDYLCLLANIYLEKTNNLKYLIVDEKVKSLKKMMNN